MKDSLAMISMGNRFCGHNMPRDRRSHWTAGGRPAIFA
jgi:hypothetical protein